MFIKDGDLVHIENKLNDKYLDVSGKNTCTGLYAVTTSTSKTRDGLSDTWRGQEIRLY